MEDRYWADVHLRAIARKFKADLHLKQASERAYQDLWAEYAEVVARETAALKTSSLTHMYDACVMLAYLVFGCLLCECEPILLTGQAVASDLCIEQRIGTR